MTKYSHMKWGETAASERMEVKRICRSGTVGSALLLAIHRAGGSYEQCARALGVIGIIGDSRGFEYRDKTLSKLYEALREWRQNDKV